MQCVLSGQISASILLCSANFPAVLSTDVSTSTVTLNGSTTTTSPLPSISHKAKVLMARHNPIAPRRAPGTGGDDSIKANAHAAKTTSSIPSADVRILWLDLQIQEFIESVRLASSLSSASDAVAADRRAGSNGSNAHTSADSLHPPATLRATSPPTNGLDDTDSRLSSTSSTSSSAAFAAPLSLAQSLFSIATSLPDLKQRIYYQKELENCSGLLIYRELTEDANVERLPPSVRSYLALSRRKELAERLNSAIRVVDEQRSDEPVLETIVLQTTAVWQAAADNRVSIVPGLGPHNGMSGPFKRVMSSVERKAVDKEKEKEKVKAAVCRRYYQGFTAHVLTIRCSLFISSNLYSVLAGDIHHIEISGFCCIA